MCRLVTIVHKKNGICSYFICIIIIVNGLRPTARKEYIMLYVEKKTSTRTGKEYYALCLKQGNRDTVITCDIQVITRILSIQLGLYCDYDYLVQNVERVLIELK